MDEGRRGAPLASLLPSNQPIRSGFVATHARTLTYAHAGSLDPGDPPAPDNRQASKAWSLGPTNSSLRRCCSHFPYLLGKEPKAHKTNQQRRGCPEPCCCIPSILLTRSSPRGWLQVPLPAEECNLHPTRRARLQGVPFRRACPCVCAHLRHLDRLESAVPCSCDVAADLADKSLMRSK
jgi:hypothetical protein